METKINLNIFFNSKEEYKSSLHSPLAFAIPNTTCESHSHNVTGLYMQKSCEMGIADAEAIWDKYDMKGPIQDQSSIFQALFKNLLLYITRSYNTVHYRKLQYRDTVSQCIGAEIWKKYTKRTKIQESNILDGHPGDQL